MEDASGEFLLHRVSGSSPPCVFFPDITETGELGQRPGFHLALPIYFLGSREEDAAHWTVLLHLVNFCKLQDFWLGYNELVMAGAFGEGGNRHLGFLC